MRFRRSTLLLTMVVAYGWWIAQPGSNSAPHQLRISYVQFPGRLSIEHFQALIDNDVDARIAALTLIEQNWNAGDAAMLIEAARFARQPATRTAIFQTLATASGQNIGRDLDAWYRWLWNQDVDPHPSYALFKETLYKRIDPRFAEYFADDPQSTIRLDEIRWGGVLRDGIPPLKNPKTISADDATYLADSDIVFGVEFGGQARAYPKRILAWHEMVKDVVGGRPINGVYCTLCGSMIVYDPTFSGRHYELGTSGFLYRSNKLMYDHQTKSMWSTLKGTPVVGPLVGNGIELTPLYVVTTTWAKWKSLHPDTDVLSLDTGYRRNYGEGVAYHDYFATDDLMFTVPKLDNRLKNKDEVLIVRDPSHEAIAISAEFLAANRVYSAQVGTRRLVVLTDESNGNRVYDIGDWVIEQWIDSESVQSSDGVVFKVTEAALVAAGTDKLPRAAAHRAFWFGWSAAFPDTKLIH